MPFTVDQILSLLASALRQTTPIGVAAIAITLSEASGVIHLSAEGIMLSAALSGVIGSYATGSPWIGLAVSLLTGLLIGVAQSFANINLKANQVVVGFGINFLGTGMTPILLQRVFGNRGRSAEVQGLPVVHLSAMRDIPFLGPVLDGQGILFFVMIALVVVVWLILQHTPLGLQIRMAGEHPVAAATAGVRLNLIRHVCVITSCGLCGIAGAELSLGQLSLFGRDMVSGRGFVAVAANVVGGWQPVGSFLASLLFGLAQAFQLRLQGGAIPNQFVQMIPYLLTVLVICGVGGLRPPRKLGVPYDPEEK
ncbi:MAG: ABC transporter permease [Chloroflexi bacterium]|nr:ABC transporter permease [Chloroflexota bacterium]